MTAKIKTLMLCICAAAAISSCSGSAPEARKTIFAMNTVMSFKAYGKAAPDALNTAAEEINRLDKMLSRTGTNGELCELNQYGRKELSEETADLIRQAVSISDRTEGAFDITIAPVMDAWGFFNQNYRVPSDDELSAALSHVGTDGIRINGNEAELLPGVQIDLGGIAKGYAADKAEDILRRSGVSSAIISLGGNISVIGSKPDGSDWTVAIKSPFKENEYIGKLSVSDCSVVTSGGYERYFEQDGKVYHHIIDPATGYPAESGLASATVVCESGTLADALSTTLFVMGREKAEEFYNKYGGFEYILAEENGEITVSPGIEDKFRRE